MAQTLTDIYGREYILCDECNIKVHTWVHHKNKDCCLKCYSGGKKKKDEVFEALRSIKRTCAKRQDFGYISCYQCQYSEFCADRDETPKNWTLPIKKRVKK